MSEKVVPIKQEDIDSGEDVQSSTERRNEGTTYGRKVLYCAIAGLALLGVIDRIVDAQLRQADELARNNLRYGALIGDCLLDNSRMVSVEARQQLIAEAGEKASSVLEEKISKPVEQATKPLDKIAGSVSPETTTTTTTTTVLPAVPQGESAAAPPITESAPPSPEQPTTTVSIPAELPNCADIPQP